MVDVSEKPATVREAVAGGEITMRPETLQQIQAGGLPKGDVLAVSRVAGIMAAKRTPDLIPLCHPLPITSASVEFSFRKPATENGPAAVEIRARVRCTGVTGVEMEALTAVTVAALTIYDMCKAMDRGMRIEHVRLIRKRGGQSGDIVLEEERADEG